MEPIVLKPSYPPRSTPIYFDLAPLVHLCQGRPGVIIADERIAKTHGVTLQQETHYEVIAIPNQKTREAKQLLEDTLLQKGFGRDALLIALGGGNLTDLVAFTASTYMRGVGCILIPTTLLAMVDAAIGGKTGIDTPLGKNLIGTFYLPEAIFIHLDYLKTLPERELEYGLSEILKMGLTFDAAIWQKASHWKEHLPFLIRASIAAKCKVVESDYEEKGGLRRILNFGHTVGHALETSLHLPHGEAVALGCMAESYLSHLLGYLSQENLQSILLLYRQLGYTFPPVKVQTLLETMARDKKGKEGKARFVLIDRIGHAVPFDGEYCRTAPLDILQKMFEWMQHGQH